VLVPACRAGGAGSASCGQARDDRPGRGSRYRQPAGGSAGCAQRRAEPRRGNRGDGAADRAGARRALSGARPGLSTGDGRRAETQGNQLYPRRRLCFGRDEARPDRADRRSGAGDRPRPQRAAVRAARQQHAGSAGAGRQDRAAIRLRWAGRRARGPPRPCPDAACPS
ncbi:hypothetical protein OY671_011093, partial [Metschnikowia pulcherrima]